MGPLKILVTVPDSDLPLSPTYTELEQKCAEQKQATQEENGWWILPDGRLLVPEALGQTLITCLHQATHLGSTKLSELMRSTLL